MYIERVTYLKQILNSIRNNPVTILTGARQVGKTTILNNLLFEGTKLQINGQLPDIIQVFSNYTSALNYLELNLNLELDGYLLIDEFQYIPNISNVLKLFCDKHRSLIIVCTGSSSLDINQKVSESLAGRVRYIPIFPLSFPEYLKFKDENLFDLYNKYTITTNDVIIDSKIQSYFNEFLIFGGLPKVVLENNYKEKIHLLEDIYLTYLVKDSRNYIKNEYSVGFNKMLKIIANAQSQQFSLNELSLISGLKYYTCSEYLYLLEQMYIIKLLEPFFTNKKKVITKTKKLFFIDNGLCNFIKNDFRDIDNRNDSGALFENCILYELIKNSESYYKYFYFRTLDGTEIDFIVNDLQKLFAIEVKYKKYSNPVKIKAIENLKAVENIGSSFVINKNYNDFSNDTKYLQGLFVSKIFK